MKFFTNSWTTSFNIYSQVGLVTLVGLDFQERNPHCRVREQTPTRRTRKIAAVAEAARVRLRPILMTTIATVAGHYAAHIRDWRRRESA